jgi:hypothetical protein
MDFIQAFTGRDASAVAQKMGGGLATALRVALKLFLGEDFVACAGPIVNAVIFHATNRSRCVA